jgi:hypothetical protein
MLIGGTSRGEIDDVAQTFSADALAKAPRTRLRTSTVRCRRSLRRRGSVVAVDDEAIRVAKPRIRFDFGLRHRFRQFDDGLPKRGVPDIREGMDQAQILH